MGKRKSKKTLFDESLLMNNELYMFYYLSLKELAMSTFEWIGLPDTINARFLEKILFESGQAVYFNDEVIGDIITNVSATSEYNYNDIPIERASYTQQGYYRNLNINNSVIIYNNMIRTSSESIARLYAYKIYDLDMAIMVNARAQKTPVLIECEESQRLTMLNLYKQYDGNEPVIFGNKGLSSKGLKVLKTDAPYVSDKLYELKTNIWNEALTFLGIANVSNAKKERMIVDEVVRNLGGTISARFSRMNMRQSACEEINKMFGTNITVRFKDVTTEILGEKDNG